MQSASLISVSQNSIVRTTDDAREKLHAALTMLDDLAPKTHLPSQSGVTEAYVRALLKSRRSRSNLFPADLFADPAWDILLELYAAELGQRRMAVTSLCRRSGVPSTTALRWINTLEKNGLLIRSNDPLDARRVFVRLSAKAADAMTAYFASNPVHG